MGKPAKPCDVADYRDRLPCLAPGEGRCFGHLCWHTGQDCKTRDIRHMPECPWIDRVRAYWVRKGYGK